MKQRKLQVFLVLLIASCVVYAGVALYRWHLEQRRSSPPTENEQQLANEKLRNQVLRIFHSHGEELLTLSRQIEEKITKPPQENEKSLFTLLERVTKGTDYTIDLIDTTGNLLAWYGDAVRDSYESTIGYDTSATLIEKGSKVFLSVSVPLHRYNAVIVLYECIDGSRFIPPVRTVFQNDIEEKVGAEGIVLLHLTEAQSAQFLVPLSFKEQNTLGYLAFEKPAWVIAHEKSMRVLDTMMEHLLFLIILIATFYGWFFSTRVTKSWMVSILKIILLWSFRYICIYFRYPGTLVDLEIFAPRLYGSTFGGGLAASLGDALFSTGVLFVSIILIRRELSRFVRRLSSHRVHRYGLAFVIITVLLAFHLFLLRAYGAAIRSFVFDSTVDFFYTSTALPSFPSLLLLGIAIVLSVAFLYTSFGIVKFQYTILHRYTPFTRTQQTVILLASGGVGVLLFTIFDKQPQVPWWSWGGILALFLAVEYFLKEKQWKVFNAQEYSYAVFIVLSSFLLSLPIIYRHSLEREYKLYESLAKELAQPVDLRMKVLLNDALDATQQWSKRGEMKAVNTSFSQTLYSLWASTRISKTNYRSAVIYYNSHGDEIDRFVVGMTTFEVQEVLRKLFEGEEETAQTIHIVQNQERIPYYGIWFTVRNSSEQQLGTIAFIVSPYMTGGYGSIGAFERKIPISYLVSRNIGVVEYEGRNIVNLFGTIENIPRMLPSHVAEATEKLRQGTWFRLQGDGSARLGFFTASPGDVSKGIGILLGEQNIGVLIFNCVKLLFAYGIVVFAVLLFALLKTVSLRTLVFGFRSRLFVGFLIVALLPLVLLGMYTQTVAHDISQQILQNSIVRDLDALERRIISYIEDEEDFIHGIDDDFCRAVATEYGIDFTIYRNAFVQASSKPEFFKASLQSKRMNGVPYSQSIIQETDVTIEENEIGGTKAVAGYKVLRIKGNPVGVLQIATIGQYSLLELDIFRRNATLLSSYAIVSLLVLIGAGVVTLRMTKPLRVLHEATQRLGRGDLAFEITTTFGNEFDDLVTSFNTMIRELRHHRIEAEKVERERAWREMAKQVAHEIRNPLTPMKLSVQHLVQIFKDRVPEREQMLRTIAQSLIEQIESLSRIASEFSSFGKMPSFRFERVNLVTVVQHAVQVFSSIPSIEFRCTYPEYPIEILADPEQLQRAFMNIIKNAVQVLDRGGVISITVADETYRNRVIIHDNGPGIPPEHLGKIFEPNFSTKTEGMGMGLAIARRIIEEMGGTIECESTVGEGTTFTITLPK